MSSYRNIKNPEEAFEICLQFAESLTVAPLRDSACKLLKSNYKELITLPGSKKHHNYKGGLVVHICNMTSIAVYIAEYYNDNVSVDFVKYAALMHDIGKVICMEDSDMGSMYDTLLNHVIVGINTLSQSLAEEFAKHAEIPESIAAKAMAQLLHIVKTHLSGKDGSTSHMLESDIIRRADELDALIDHSNGDDTFDDYAGTTYYRAINMDEFSTTEFNDSDRRIRKAIMCLKALNIDFCEIGTVGNTDSSESAIQLVVVLNNDDLSLDELTSLMTALQDMNILVRFVCKNDKEFKRITDYTKYIDRAEV